VDNLWASAKPFLLLRHPSHHTAAFRSNLNTDTSSHMAETLWVNE
jgi:hypothetical protein